MTFSDKGRTLLKQLEGYKDKAYQDSAGIWTIGYGTVCTAGVPRQCTEEQANGWLSQKVLLIEKSINANVRVPITQEQFDALVIFAYNVGINALITSTLLRLLNDRHYTEAAEQFGRWCHAGGKVVQGLANRRARERELFLCGTY